MGRCFEWLRWMQHRIGLRFYMLSRHYVRVHGITGLLGKVVGCIECYGRLEMNQLDESVGGEHFCE